MAADKRRLRRQHHHQIGGLESLPVDHAEIALDRRSHPISRAEGVFAADVEWQLRLQFAGSVSEEAGEAAKMVIMSMAQHQRVEAGGLNPDERQIVLTASGVKPKSIRICLVSSPRWLSTCIESPKSLTSVLPGG